MRTVLRKVGNSRGVLIPAAFLAKCGVGTEIEMRKEGRGLVLEPVKTVRFGWFDGYQAGNEMDAGEEEMASHPLKVRTGSGKAG